MIPILVISAVVLYIALLTLWLVAEHKRSKPTRIALGLAVLVFALPLPLLLVAGIVQLDDNSFYAASMRTVLCETTEALEFEEEGFLDRLKAFRESQRLTYESRSDLLENVRAFHQEGKRIRAEMECERSGIPVARNRDAGTL